MPGDIPEVPRFNFGTSSYRDLVNLVNLLADLMQQGWIIDGNQTTIEDSVGGSGRAINFNPIAAIGAIRPLMLIDASDGSAKAGVIAGSVQSTLVDGSQTVAVSDGDSVWLEFALTYTAVSNTWVIDSLTTMDAGTFPALPWPLETLYVLLGTVSVDSDVATPHPTINGSQAWIRTGNVDSYADYLSDGT